MRELRIFDVSYNKLTKIDASFCVGKLKLEKMELAGNCIDTIETGAFRGCRNLEFMILNDNLLRELPEDILVDKPRLVMVNVSKNKFEEYPAALKIWGKGLFIVCDGNPIRSLEWP